MNRSRKIINGYEDKQDSQGLWIKSWPVKLDGDKYTSHEMSISARRWNYILTRCRLRDCLEGYGQSSTCGFKNFQEFAEWSQTQIGYLEFEVVGSKTKLWNLDKDLLSKEDKVYSPETCLFVPSYVNSFITNSKQKGDKLLGVSKSSKNRYQAVMGGVYIGNYSSDFEAHMAWVRAKAEKARTIADSFELYHPKLCQALNSYAIILEYYWKHDKIYVG